LKGPAVYSPVIDGQRCKTF